MLWTKLKLVAAGIVGATLAAGGAGALIVRPEATQDGGKFDGPAAPGSVRAPAAPPAPVGAPPEAPRPPDDPPRAEPAPSPDPSPRPRQAPTEARAPNPRPGRAPAARTPRDAPTRRRIGTPLEPTSELSAEVRQFRESLVGEIRKLKADKLAELDKALQDARAVLPQAEEKVREAERSLAVADKTLSDHQAAVAVVQQLRDNLAEGRGLEEVDLDDDGRVDLFVAPASSRRPRADGRRPEPSPGDPPSVEGRLESRPGPPPRGPIDEREAGGKALLPPSDSDRITALERRFDRLFELIEGKNSSGLLKP